MSTVAVDESARYQPSYGLLPCAGEHPRSGGQVDERARRLSHSEYAVARILASEGHDVRALPETPGRGPRPDLAVCNGTTEVKSWTPASERGGGSPSPYSVYDKLVDASKQSDTVFLYGVGTGLTEKVLRKGLERYDRHPPKDLEPLRNIRVKGDGFDLSFSRSRERSIDPPAPARERGPELGL